MKIQVEKISKPIRLDQYLAARFNGFSRAQITRQIKSGRITVAGVLKVKPSLVLSGGEEIVLGEDVFRAAPKAVTVQSPSFSPAPEILYEDENLLAVDKPAGVIVCPAPHQSGRSSVAGWFWEKFPQVRQKSKDRMRPGIVHRLDKETSGVLLLAKNDTAADYLKNLFQTRQIHKTYLALVRGEIKKDRGTIDFALTRSAQSPAKRKVAIGKSEANRAKKALTVYRVLRRYSGYTFLEVSPQTGRTHQIRVHLASSGFPVAGDKLYGHTRRPEELGLARHFLHAQRISFVSSSGKPLVIEAPLPADLQQVLEKLNHQIDEGGSSMLE